MIKITRIRIKGDVKLQSRKQLEQMRDILTKHFGAKDILFEYEDDGKEETK